MQEEINGLCRFYGLGGEVYDRVTREALWHLLTMYDMGGKLLNGIKSVNMQRVDQLLARGPNAPH